LEDGKVFQKIISAMKGQYDSQQLATVACESAVSITVDDLFRHLKRQDSAAIPPVWKSMLKEISTNTPEV